jgi:hypothetical protein
MGGRSIVAGGSSSTARHLDDQANGTEDNGRNEGYYR